MALLIHQKNHKVIDPPQHLIEEEGITYIARTDRIDLDNVLIPLIIAVIEEPSVIERILTHLGLSAQPPPRAPARRVDLFQAA